MRIRKFILLFGILNVALYSALLPLWEGFDEPFGAAAGARALAGRSGWRR